MSGVKVVVAGSGSALIQDKAMLRDVRGSLWQSLDLRFATVASLSLLIHSILIYQINMVKLPPIRMIMIEKIPERFAKLIVDKPLPKPDKKPKSEQTKGAGDAASERPEAMPPRTEAREPKVRDRKEAKKAVAARAARVEKKIRTVGVLGMLTGVGTTASGPSVVDVLASAGRRGSGIDLETALANMDGLKRTSDIDVLDRKLVRSKEARVDRRMEIDDLVADITTPAAASLAKKGNFVIQRPESIEGAAATSAKRDTRAINKIVSSHKTSIRMTYEKYLKRDPGLAGKVTIRFTIAASGRVTAVQALENTTGSPELEHDILRKIRMWRFEQVSEGDATVTYPFVFRPS